MKLLQYPTTCHPKNTESMKRMCAAVNMEYEATDEQDRVADCD